MSKLTLGDFMCTSDWLKTGIQIDFGKCLPIQNMDNKDSLNININFNHK